MLFFLLTKLPLKDEIGVFSQLPKLSLKKLHFRLIESPVLNRCA